MKRVFTPEQLRSMLNFNRDNKEDENLALMFHKLHQAEEINFYQLIASEDNTEIDITMKVNGEEVDLGMFEKMVNQWFIEQDEKYIKNKEYFERKVKDEVEIRLRDIFEEIEYEGINKIRDAVEEARLKVESISSDINWEARKKNA